MHLYPKLSGCLTGAFFEYVGEVPFFVVAQVKTDFGDLFVGVCQLVFGLNQLAGFNDLGHGLMEDVFTDQVEIAGGHEQFLCVKINAEGPLVIFFENFKKAEQGGILVVDPSGRLRGHFVSLRFHHDEQGAQQMFHDRQIGILLLHFGMHDFTESDQPVKAGASLHLEGRVVMVESIQLESSIGDEFAFESQHPHVALTLEDPGYGTVHFPFGDKADQWGFECGGFEIDEMLQPALYPDDQLLVVMLMRFIRRGTDLTGLPWTNFEEVKQGIHSIPRSGGGDIPTCFSDAFPALILLITHKVEAMFWERVR